ncbi:hypothetical protein [Enhygromyxa salina]|uniref:Uncharacterized protein n=1 Tax=Enhygromyxa salina TaxID=215803 RepID=A0A2S9YJD4_9BACT|nr:hypothetical protein [Enhygromyxa salina]PRQ05209.1 hypothetical protein ENSA7_46590 [Enhygromyxa salina]
MSLIAVASSIVILIIGGLCLVYGEGYSFDLRGKQKGRVAGGRRASDR